MPSNDRFGNLGKLVLGLTLSASLLLSEPAAAQTEPAAAADRSEAPFIGSEPPKSTEPAVTSAPAPAQPAPISVPAPRARSSVERKVIAAVEPERAAGYSARGLALEALTSSFASGGLGNLLIGYKWSRVTLGGNVGFAKYTGSSTAGSEDRIAVKVGPGLRAAVLQSEDERTELYLHGDLGLIILNATLPAEGSRTEGTSTSAALQLNAGAGVRYWVTHNLAVGYVAMLKFTSSVSQPSKVLVLEVPESMGVPGWYLDGSFVVAAAF